MSTDYQWPRGKALSAGCPKGFYYNDFVETNDGLAAGWVRGMLNPGSTPVSTFYTVLLSTGDALTFTQHMLKLVFRIEDPIAREAAYESYVKNR